MEIQAFLNHRETDTPNVLLVRDVYRGMREGDKATLVRVLADHLTWHVCPGNPEGGTFNGRDEINAFYGKFLKSFHTFMAAPEAFVDGGDVVVALGFYRFTVGEGSPVRSVRFSHAWKITPDGRVAGVWQVSDSAEMRRLMEADASMT